MEEVLDLRGAVRELPGQASEVADVLLERGTSVLREPGGDGGERAHGGDGLAERFAVPGEAADEPLEGDDEVVEARLAVVDRLQHRIEVLDDLPDDLVLGGDGGGERPDVLDEESTVPPSPGGLDDRSGQAVDLGR